MNPTGCLTQLIKPFLYLYCFLIVLFNIGMIALPILKLQMSPEDAKTGVFKFINEMPYLAAIVLSLVSLSIWYLSYKLGKFHTFLSGVMWVGILTIIYSFSASFLVQMTRTTLGVEFSVILGTFPLFIAIFLISKDIYKAKKTPKEPLIKQFSKKEDKDSLNFKTSNGVINLANPFRGIYVQGGAGSGKSASIFEPIIKQIAEQEYTGILYDFKSPELTEKVRASYLDSIVEFRNIDFKNAHQSDRINPIAPNYLSKSVIALEYSQTLVNNLIPESIKKADFWSNTTKMILSGVIWWLKEEHPKYCTIPHAISLLLHTDTKTLLEEVSKNYEAGGMVATLRQSFEKEAGNQTAGILSTIQTAIAQLNSKDVFWILSGNDVDLNLNNPQKPTFLCLGNDSTLPQVYAPVISLIISVAMRQMNKPNQQKSVVLLDEAPTIYIPNIEQIPATARSNKIATIFGVQDFSQLVDNYGQDKAQIILANLGNQFFGRVTNGKTAEMVQKLFSKEDRTFINKNTGTGTGGTIVHTQSNQSKGKSETIQERDRVKVSDLINLEPGEFYGIIAEGKPKEFLKTQFLEDFAEIEINKKLPITEQEMNDNYFKIIEEAKSLLD
jgi:hypothetical protein